MPPGPSLFDDASAPEPDRATTAARPAPSTATARGSNTPNYWIRRGIVVGGVVAVLATAAVVVGQLTGSDTSNVSSGALRAEWNRVVLLDERTGQVVVTSSDGNEVGRIESGIDAPVASGVVEQSMMITSADVVAVLDLDTASDMSTAGVYPFGADLVITPVGSALTMIAQRSDAGRAVIVHGPSGDVIDTDALATVTGARYDFGTARATRSGRHVLVTDTGNFQSVLFSFDRDEPSYFPGLALTVGDDVVVTAQNVGADATVNVFDHDGELLATGSTSSVRAGMVADSGVVLVTVDGAVATMSTSSGDVDDGTELDIGTVASGAVTTSGDRLVVTGSTGTALVDDSAALVGSFAGVHLGDAATAPTGAQCVELESISENPEPRVAVVDVADGVVVIEAPAMSPMLIDASGCVVAAPTAVGFDLFGPDGIEQVQTTDVLEALAPDGSMVVVERSRRLLLLDPFAAELSMSPIDLGPAGRVVHFTQL